jgi:phosphoribosylanthranilate isomerase
VIKAFGIDDKFDFDRLKKYAGNLDVFLFDTKTERHGGSGQVFDWGLLDRYKLNVPFFISGGLSLNNLEEVIAIEHPMFYGVDLNSQFETTPGIKDIRKLEKAFKIINNISTNEIRG